MQNNEYIFEENTVEDYMRMWRKVCEPIERSDVSHDMNTSEIIYYRFDKPIDWLPYEITVLNKEELL